MKIPIAYLEGKLVEISESVERVKRIGSEKHYKYLLDKEKQFKDAISVLKDGKGLRTPLLYKSSIKEMKNIPKKIYLQIDADGETPEDFKELAGVSWCAERISPNDIEFILNETTEEIEKKSLCRNCQEITNSISMGVMCDECYCEK
jgi:hypothetical protein